MTETAQATQMKKHALTGNVVTHRQIRTDPYSKITDNVGWLDDSVVCMYVCMYLIRQMQTTDKATTKKRTQWQDSKAQHALTTALDKKIF